MFALLSGFYEELTFVPERRVVMLGLKSSGKTALLECMKQEFMQKPARWRSQTHCPTPGVPEAKLEALQPTVGLNVARLPTGEEHLLIWDLGGAEPLRPIWNRYVDDAEALIWVVDASDPETLPDSSKCLRELLTRNTLCHAPLLVYANKQDGTSPVDAVKTSMALDLLSDAELRPQCVQPCSAKTGAGVTEGLQWLVSWLRNPKGDLKTSIKDT